MLDTTQKGPQGSNQGADENGTLGCDCTPADAPRQTQEIIIEDGGDTLYMGAEYMPEHQEHASQMLGDAIEALAPMYSTIDSITDMMEQLRENSQGILSYITQLCEEGEAEKRRALEAAAGIKAGAPTLEQIVASTSVIWAKMLCLGSVVEEMGPYLEKEIARPEYQGRVTMEALLEPVNPEWEEDEDYITWWEQAVANAQMAKQKPRRRYSKKAPQDAPQAPYSPIIQGKAINTLHGITQKLYSQNMVTGTYIARHNGLEIMRKRAADLPIDTVALMVLDILLEKLARSLPMGRYGSVPLEQIDKGRCVTISVREYAERRQLKDLRTAREQLRKAVLALWDTELRWKESRYMIPPGKKCPENMELSFASRIITVLCGPDNLLDDGVVAIRFEMEIAKYLSGSFIMPFPNVLYTTSIKRHPHAYDLGRRLALHHNMNIGKANSNIISVKTLVESLPNMPRHEDVKNSRFLQLIITPFEANLDALTEAYHLLDKWEYCNSKGEPLTDDQLAAYNYASWITWLVKFSLADYPDQTRRIEKKAEKIEAPKAKRAAKKPMVSKR